MLKNLLEKGDFTPEAAEQLIAEIDDKKEKIELLKEAIRNAKADRVCANCGAVIDKDTIFCPICGQKLEFTTEE